MTVVAVIFGGQSPEHEVSIVSARFVIAQLAQAGYQPLAIGIDREGGWHTGPEAFNALCEGQVGGERKSAAIARLVEEAEVVFPMIHGITGEDGCIQGLCHLLNLPYIGGDSLNQSLCWDKLATRTILLQGGLPQLPYLAYYKAGFDSAAAVAEICDRFTLPVFVKPSRTGSSVGITRVTAAADLPEALALAFRYDSRLIVEPGVTALEVEIAGLGAFEPELSPAAQIIPENDFYDFEEKYLKDTTRFEIPAPLTIAQRERLCSIAKRAWQLLNCFGLARIDFLVTDEEVYLNEINTLPGFTSISMYPRLMRENGVASDQLMKRLVDLALQRETLVGCTNRFETRLDWYKE